MKIYNYAFALLSTLILVSSCSKDKGNYDYKEINELSITEVKAEYASRTTIDTLNITPGFKATMDDADTSRYRYLWILQVSAKVRDTISRSRNLTYPINLDPATYNLYFRVLDNKTGVTWTADTKVNVTTAFSRGLLIIGENEQGNAEAEMLSMLGDTIHVKNILGKSGLPALRNPVSFVHTSGVDTYSKLWIFTESGSYYLNRATLSTSTANNFNKSLYISEELDPATLYPVALAPQVRTVAGLTGSTIYRGMITKGGEVFGSILFYGGDYFNNPVNRVASAQDVRLPAAPYLLYPIGSMSSFIWYDTQNQRFLNYTGIGSAIASSVLIDAPGSIFPWNQPPGRTLVYAENTRNSDGGSTNGNSFAIMKDADNTHHIYKFYANGTNPAKRAAYMVKPIARDFDKARAYAFSSSRTVIFYTVGNKLYAYDYNPNNEKFYEFPEIGSDEISMIKFDTQIDFAANILYVATYNSATKGTLRRFKVGTNPNFVDLTIQPNSTWSDMVKIKDVNWRAIN